MFPSKSEKHYFFSFIINTVHDKKKFRYDELFPERYCPPWIKGHGATLLRNKTMMEETSYRHEQKLESDNLPEECTNRLSAFGASSEQVNGKASETENA